MRIAVTGSSGLIGKELVKCLNAIEISRKNGAWDPEEKKFNSEFFKDLDVLIHLAGEGIANKRWNKKQKELLYSSRIESTNFLAEIVKNSPPKLFISASGIGIYGSRKDEILNESSTPGVGFLAELSKAWEDAADRVKANRTIKMRLGVVLSKQGGALKKMLLPFKLGVGGKIGSGNQYMSWISLTDVVNAIKFCIENKNLEGAINFCSPTPETNENFSKKLAKALGRPCLFPVPELVIKTVFGEMGEELLLSSTRSFPEKLTNAGFKFKDENLETAFRNLFG